MFIIYLLLFLAAVYWVWFKLNYQKRYGRFGLKGPAPLPIIGNFFDVQRVPFWEYERTNNERFGSTYVDYILSIKGCITTSDPELLKRILVKDFHSFQYRVAPRYLPKYARRALIFMHEDWKRVRALITPVFTSGRLKLMYNNFDYPITNCVNNIQELIDAQKGGNIECKKIMRSFSLDIIANVVFSLKTHCYKDDDFSQRVVSLFSPRIPLAILSFVLPSFISEFFDISLFDSKTVQYFAKLTIGLIEERKKGTEQYNDFLYLLLKSEADGEGKIEANYTSDGKINRKLSTEEIVAACLVFFLGGMETVSGQLVHILLELALNPEVQEKLAEEIASIYPTDEVNYDAINDSAYLEACLKESLRMHLALNRVFRVALDDVDFGKFKIQAGQVMGVSIYNVHHNPEIYPEPYKFRPERFLNNEVDENLYMPFSLGPRNCVAERFAILELKSLIIRLVKKFKFSINEHTMSYKYKTGIIVNLIDEKDGGLKLKIENRT